jgi:hypothetical protein
MGALRSKLAHFRRLVDAGMKPSGTYGPLRSSPLHIAVYFNDEPLCRALLMQGASMHAKDDNGDSPFDVASAKGLDHIVTLMRTSFDYTDD